MKVSKARVERMFQLWTPSTFRSLRLQGGRIDATILLAFARRMRPSSSHLPEGWDKIPGSPHRLRQRHPIRPKPARHAWRWWYHILSEVFWGRAPNSRKRSDSLVHRTEELLLFLPCARIEKDAPNLIIEAFFPKIEWNRDHITRPSWSKNPTCHLQWRHSVTTTNTP